jgi:phosphatidylinositol phospholipase C gamma-1
LPKKVAFILELLYVVCVRAVAPVDKYEKELPSPDKLRRKIILKHKKLPEGADENAGVPIDLDSSKNMDLSDSLKNGMLYIQEEPGDEQWKPHFFVLTPRQMVYSELPGVCVIL